MVINSQPPERPAGGFGFWIEGVAVRLNFSILIATFFAVVMLPSLSFADCFKDRVAKCNTSDKASGDYGECSSKAFIECNQADLEKQSQLEEATAWLEKTYAEYPISTDEAAKSCLGEGGELNSENILSSIDCLKRKVHSPPIAGLRYCDKVASATGHRSESTYKTCVKEEFSKKSQLKEVWARMPDQSRAYCKQVASVTGELSYSTLLLCAKQELAAATPDK